MTKKTEKTLTPAIDLLLPSIEIIKNNLPVYFLLSVVPSLLVTIGTRDTNDITELLTPIGVVGSLLGLMFMAPLIYTQNRTAKGKIVTIGESLRKGYKFFWRLIGLALVFSLLLIVGFILFIIPGFIVLRRYFLSFYYLVDKDLSIKEAMKKSAASSAKNSLAIYGVVAVMLIFTLFTNIPAVGAIFGAILQFLYSVAPALRYHEMRKAYK